MGLTLFTNKFLERDFIKFKLNLELFKIGCITTVK